MTCLPLNLAFSGSKGKPESFNSKPGQREDCWEVALLAKVHFRLTNLILQHKHAWETLQDLSFGSGGGFLIIECFVTDCCVSQGTGGIAARLMLTAQQAKHQSSSHSHFPAPSCCNNVNEEPYVCGTAQPMWHKGQWAADSLLKTPWVDSKMVTAYAQIGWYFPTRKSNDVG